MAHLLRSMAVIGVIALHSPVHGERAAGTDAAETTRHAPRASAQFDIKHAAQSLTAAREAAEIIAGLDPETRQRLTALVISAATAEAARPRR